MISVLGILKPYRECLPGRVRFNDLSYFRLTDGLK